MSENLLQAKQIVKNFGGVRALRQVDLNIKKGEVHCLAGENGSGKSTIIKVICGVHQADAGEIVFDGTTYEKLSPTEAINAGIQVIYQDFSVFPNLTVMENLALTSELSNNRKIVNWKRFRELANKALDTINVSLDLDEYVENLSVADKQLIAICRALLSDAKLLIMDEPTTALTKREVESLFDIIRKLKEQGISVLFVSHKIDEVFEISDSFTIFRSGKNVFSGPKEELNDEKFTYYMTGRTFDVKDSIAPYSKSENLLEVKDLTLDNAFYDVSFSLGKGEILGITGLLGSGQTELAQCLYGYHKATSGSMKLEETVLPVASHSINKAIKNGIGYVPEDRLTEGLFLKQSISNNILVGTWGEMADALGLLNEHKLNEETQKWISALSIKAPFPHLPVQTLSGGNQQKVVLARWLAQNLKLLILNGPTVGVDIGAKYDIHALIRQLAEEGLSVIMVSDDLPEILGNCHRVLAMKNGRIVKEVGTREITQEKLNDIITSA